MALLKYKKIAAGLLSLPQDHVLSIQAARVLAELRGADPDRDPASPEQALSLFIAKALVPRKSSTLSPKRDLLAILDKAEPGTGTMANALAFSVCAFPQRYYQMKSALFERTAEFVRAMPYLDRMTPEQALARRIGRAGDIGREAKDVLTENLPELLSGLGGIAPELRLEREEESRRSKGAALFLLTCSDPMIERVALNWRAEGEFVAWFRAYATTPSPPPLPEGTGVGFGERLNLIHLSLRKVAQTWPAGLRRDGDFTEAWETYWEKLNRGFPYYAFLSLFIYWLKYCFKRHSLSRDNLTAPQDMEKHRVNEQPGPLDFLPGENRLSLDELRVFREGHRLVRTTFFDRGGDREKTEALRGALDRLWEGEILAGMLEGPVHSRAAGRIMEQIASEQDYPPKSALASAHFRFRRRIWAYTLGRVRRMTNQEILWVKPPAPYAREGGGRPLNKEPGVLMVATLAKTALFDYSLLGAFTGHVFLTPRINSRLGRPWETARYLAEAEHWLKPEGALSTLKWGARRGCRVDEALLEVLREGFLGETCLLLERNPRDLDWAAAVGGVDAGRIETLALQKTEALARAAGWQADGPDNSIPPLPNAKSGNHWVIPVWFLRFVEGLTPDQVMERLRVDGLEKPFVMRLMQAGKGSGHEKD